MQRATAPAKLQQGFIALALVQGNACSVLLVGGEHRVQCHLRGVAAPGKAAVFVVHIGHAAGHACGKVASGGAQHHDGAAGHVFAAVVARAFHHSAGARKAYSKALPGHPGKEGLA